MGKLFIKPIIDMRKAKRVLVLLGFILFYGIQVNAQSTYIITRGDVLDVVVMEHPEFSLSGITVLPDGYVQYPALGSIMAAGMSSQALTDTLQYTLQKYIVNPIVTIYIRKIKKQQVNIFGYVNNPGQYQLYEGVDLFSAIGLAGGIKSLKKVKEINIIRANRTLEVIKVKDYFNHDLTENEIPLVYAGDTVYIKEPKEFSWAKGAFFLNAFSLTVTLLSLLLK